MDRRLRRVPPPRRLWLPEEHYYRTAERAAWATALASRDAALADLYPQLIHRAIEAFGSEDALRLPGRRVTAEGHVPAHLKDAVTSDPKRRPEGVRIERRAGRDTVKLYDKRGPVLRVETTRNEVQGLKRYRAAADDPDGPRAGRPMRKGVAEMPRRAELSQASNDRYPGAPGELPTGTPLCRAAGKLCRPVVIEGRRSRALNPLAGDDARLLGAIGRGEWLVAGPRNRDIRRAWYGDAGDAATRRRQAGRVARLLGLLRAHGLIKKVPRTRRDLRTKRGATLVPAPRAVNHATLQQLTSAA